MARCKMAKEKKKSLLNLSLKAVEVFLYMWLVIFLLLSVMHCWSQKM